MRSPNEFNWEKEWMEVEKGAELKKTKLQMVGKKSQHTNNSRCK